MEVKFAPGFKKSLRRAIWWERTKYLRPRYWKNEIKWFIQRGRRGWADCDTWSFDDHLQEVIAGGCRYLKDHHMGVPNGVGKHKTDEYGWETHIDIDKADEEWVQILEDIAVGFQAFGKMKWEDDLHIDSAAYKGYQAQYDKAFRLFKKHFGSLWD